MTNFQNCKQQTNLPWSLYENKIIKGKNIE